MSLERESWMTIQHIAGCINNNAVEWTEHVYDRLMQRRISYRDVFSCIRSGRIIEKYIEDKPMPSCLILGPTMTGQRLHVVVAANQDAVRVITAYFPDEAKWHQGFSTRRR